MKVCYVILPCDTGVMGDILIWGRSQQFSQLLGGLGFSFLSEPRGINLLGQKGN